MDIDLDTLAYDLGLVLKSGQKEARRKRFFWCAANRLRKPDVWAICFHEKKSFQLASCSLSWTPANHFHLSAPKQIASNDCRQFIISALCRNCSRQSNGFWNFKRTWGFDTLENKASKVSNLKYGWRCQGISDTLVTLFELPVKTNLLYEKQTIAFSPHALRLVRFTCKDRAYGTWHLPKTSQNDCFAVYRMLESFSSALVTHFHTKIGVKNMRHFVIESKEKSKPIRLAWTTFLC